MSGQLSQRESLYSQECVLQESFERLLTILLACFGMKCQLSCLIYREAYLVLESSNSKEFMVWRELPFLARPGLIYSILCTSDMLQHSSNI